MKTAKELLEVYDCPGFHDKVPVWLERGGAWCELPMSDMRDIVTILRKVVEEEDHAER